MVQDRSNDFRETWGFLDRRMEDVATFAKYRGQVGEKEGGEGERERERERERGREREREGGGRRGSICVQGCTYM